jgi:hypothetical protein
MVCFEPSLREIYLHFYIEMGATGMRRTEMKSLNLGDAI